MELTSGEDGSKNGSSMAIVEEEVSVQETAIAMVHSEKDLGENSASTCVMSPLFEGECEVTKIDEKISEDRKENKNEEEVNISLDLNETPIDEEYKGGEGDEIAEENENSSSPIQGLPVLDLIHQQIEEDHISINGHAIELANGLEQNDEVEEEIAIRETTEDNGAVAGTNMFEFDLNELPIDADEVDNEF